MWRPDCFDICRSQAYPLKKAKKRSVEYSKVCINKRSFVNGIREIIASILKRPLFRNEFKLTKFKPIHSKLLSSISSEKRSIFLELLFPYSLLGDSWKIFIISGFKQRVMTRLKLGWNLVFITSEKKNFNFWI